ncbi:hypothetical protein [Rhizobium sp. X9]|uniref:hypothetical protein n=1 Tax=Rhizobium sp. X9 TaxID=2815360 RepID=UPI001C0BB3C0|nr:hypothetical protein [Rhizobium sp. X9]
MQQTDAFGEFVEARFREKVESVVAVFKTIEKRLRYAYKRRQLRSAGIMQNNDGAILVTGGLGDLIVVARFLRDLLAHLGGGKFSIFYNSPAVAEMVFQNVPGFSGAYPSHFFKYAKDICLYGLTINQFIYIEKWPDHRAMAVGDARIYELVRILEAHEKKIEPISLMRFHHPFLDGTLGRYAAIKGRCRNDFLHYAAGIGYGGGRAIPEQGRNGFKSAWPGGGQVYYGSQWL